MIDYEEIVNNLRDEDIFTLLDKLGGEPVDKGTYIISRTICHNVDNGSKKLYYYKNSHMFYCYTECGSMNIFVFLKHYYETQDIEYDWYNDILQVILNCSAFTAPGAKNARAYKSRRDEYIKAELKSLQVYPDGVLDTFIKYYPIEWLNDSISRETMDKYNIKFSVPQNKIIIPHYNINGELVGIRGRALNQQEVDAFGKYMPVQIENKWYSHPLSLNLYGLNLNKENIQKYRVCYIFESEKSVMQLESFNIPNCAVACCGSNINKYQIGLLVKYCQPQEIIVCFDREEKENEHSYFDKLYKICKKYSQYCNMSFIYDRKGLSKMKDSPSDNGQEIFEKLLKGRVQVK